jgi:acyl dehydratase
MSLDLSALGYQTAPHEFKYDWKAPVLYALGVGATQSELDYLFEGRGPRVLPTFAVVPAYAPVTELLDRSGADLMTVVHTGQAIRLRRPIPAQGTLTTVGRIRGIYDMKRMALAVLETATQSAGQTCCETEWTILLRGEGRFGGDRPPRSQAPTIPDAMAPSWIHEQTTSGEQALLYRLSGDTNPLHVDPNSAAAAGFAQGPILHGLCIYGFVARAAIRHACRGDADAVIEFGAQFKRPIWPGETLQTRGYDLGGGQIALRACATQRPDSLVAYCWAKLST